MQGVEKQVLSIIKRLKEAEIESIAGKLGVSIKYTSEICSTLVNDGYLVKTPAGKFKLMLKGKEFTSPAVKASKPLIRW